MSATVPDPGAFDAPAVPRSRPSKALELTPSLRHRLQRSFRPRIRARLLRRLPFGGGLGRDGTVPARSAGKEPKGTPCEGAVEIHVDAGAPPGEARQAALRAAEEVAERPAVERIVASGENAGAVRPFLAEVARVSGCRLFQEVSPDGAGTPETNGAGPRRRCVQEGPPVWQLAAKRAVDVLGAAGGLVLLTPLFAAVTVGIKLTSPGPVFFRQWRVGLGGRHFRIFKFRTMIADSERRAPELRSRSVYGDGRLFKVPSDPRVTAFGRILRRTSLDELPQLLDVLRGTMSLVGPRPPLPEEVDEYRPEHHCRFDRRPGMSGPWQVSGRNRITDFEKIVRLERAYMSGWSIWKDFGILLRTIPAVIEGDGAE